MSRDGKDRPTGPAEKGVTAGSGTGSRRRPYRRAVRIGLAVSALFHLALFLFLGSARLDRPRVSPLPARSEAPEGLTVILLRVTPPEPEESEARPPATGPATPPRARQRPETPAALPAGEPEATEPALTNAERLQPRMGDERLWVDFRHPIRPGSVVRDRYAEAVNRLRQIVRVWLDSLQLSEEQRRRALDWTFGEGNERWGISPEGLHLGDMTIPIPFGSFFQQGGPLGRQAEQALRDLREIQAQEVRHEVEDVLEERREAMRRRSEEEAERRKKDTTDAGG